MVDLSPGQERLREIVAENYPAYRKHMEEVGYYDVNPTYCKPILEAFRSEPVITQDRITGQHFDDLNISPKYLLWQAKKAGNKWDDWKCQGKTPATVRLDKYYSDESGYFFEGDTFWKQSSTYSCLMGLHEGKDLAVMESVTYFVQEGVLKRGGSGHHRTLAHVLYGEPIINTKSHYMVETEPDPTLNIALLKIDNFFKELSDTSGFKQSDRYLKRKRDISFSIHSHGTEKEMEGIKNFYLETSDKEWNIMRQIILDCIVNKKYSCRFAHNNEVYITDLIQFLNDIRNVQGLGYLGTVGRKFYNRLPAHRHKVSHLERHLLNLRDFEKEAREKDYEFLGN